MHLEEIHIAIYGIGQVPWSIANGHQQIIVIKITTRPSKYLPYFIYYLLDERHINTKLTVTTIYCHWVSVPKYIGYVPTPTLTPFKGWVHNDEVPLSPIYYIRQMNRHQLSSCAAHKLKKDNLSQHHIQCTHNHKVFSSGRSKDRDITIKRRQL